MNAKRLTALALAALMATSTMSVAFATPAYGDEGIDFFPNTSAYPYRDQLYMMDEDGYIRPANRDDFAPGDDIYIQLDYGDDLKSKNGKPTRYDAYADWDIGKSWVDDVEIVYKKGNFVVAKPVASATYTIKGFNNGLDGFSFTTDLTDATALLNYAKEQLKKSSNFTTVRDALIESNYKKDAWTYNGKVYATEQAAKDAAAADVKEEKGFEVDNTWKSGDPTTFGYKETTKIYTGNGGVTTGTLEGALSAAGWKKWNGEGKYFASDATVFANGGGTISNTGDAENKLTGGTIYVGGANGNGPNGSATYIDISKISDDSAKSLETSITQVQNDQTAWYDSSDVNHKIVTIKKDVNKYTDSQGKDLGNDKNSAVEAAQKNVQKNEAYFNGETVIDAAEATKLATNDVTAIIDGMTAGNYSVTTRGTPTGSHQYENTSGYTWWLKISTNESATTKDIDIVGTVDIGTSRSSAEKNSTSMHVDVTLTNADPDNSYFDEVDGYVDIEPGERAVLSFADDATDVEIEFGDDARFEFNARGQGKLNFAYNTKYNKEFASDYESANIDFINFEGEPTTNRTGTLYIYADEDSYIYEVTSKGAKKINGAYYDDDEEAWVIRTRHLTSYAISDKKLKTVDQMSSGSSSSGSTGGSTSGSSNSGSGSNGGKYNPDTGR